MTVSPSESRKGFLPPRAQRAQSGHRAGEPMARPYKIPSLWQIRS